MNDSSFFLDINELWSNSQLLQEPVSFEEFEFSVNVEPDSILSLNNPTSLMDNDYSCMNNSLALVNPIQLQKDPFIFNCTNILNENEQKTFSGFLDSFFDDHEEDSTLKSTDEETIQKNCSSLSKKRSNSYQSSAPVAKKSKILRELLTEDEKRANHIASEQKRRGMIRNGFRELTELVPTLKNINNSKSTVLFKSVEFIHHLERKNKALREKLESLEIRMKVEGRQAPVSVEEKVVKKNNFQELPQSTRNALLAHKSQQKQLLLLQEQLHMHQKRMGQKQASILQHYYEDENKAIRIL